MTDTNDRYDQLCTQCGIGRYHETSIYDDWDGVLHCTNRECNHEVKRYKSKDNPPPKPKMVKLSSAAQTVLDAGLGRDSDRLVIAAALRAAADQVVPEQAKPVGDSHDEARHDQWMRIRYRFLAIADELEGQ